MFDIPIQFRMLSFYIYEKDRLKRSDPALGKVALKRAELHKCQSKDQWYPLTPIDHDTEVQVGACIPGVPKKAERRIFSTLRA